MDYLRWSKVHLRVQYELTRSGVPDVNFEGFGPRPSDFELETLGSYGDPELIRAIGARYAHPVEGIVPVPGASGGNFVALCAVAKHGDLVAIEQPVYEPITRVVEFLGLRQIPLHRGAENGFGVVHQEIENALHGGARAVILTNLHNPSGRFLEKERIKAIADSCRSADACLVIDEVYLDAASLAQYTEPWTGAVFGAQVVTVNSLTKVYGLSGLRAGWILTGAELAERAREMMDLTSVVNAAPAAALARRVLSNIKHFEDRYRLMLVEGQRVFRDWLKREHRVQGYTNHGAVFELVRLKGGVTGDRLNDLLTQRFETQVVPGRFFGLPDHVRLGTALPAADLTEGLARISSALDILTQECRDEA